MKITIKQKLSDTTYKMENQMEAGEQSPCSVTLAAGKVAIKGSR